MGNRVQINQPAPEFSLVDANGKQVRLSDFHGKKNVLLVFNRGFT
jgi:peroxiredoxin